MTTSARVSLAKADLAGRFLLRSRLFAVRRLLAFVLIQALVVSTAAGASLHVHEYLGHDHPDHHHGPATHDHEHPTEPARDHHSVAEDDHTPAIQAESCDPGRHAVSVSLGCAFVSQLHIAVGVLPGPTFMVPSVPIQSAVRPRDVRVHGPPFDPRTPSRAPPLTPHA